MGALAVLCALGLAACGSSHSTYVTTNGGKPPVREGHAVRESHTVRIYSSLPLHGPERAESEAIIMGIRVARRQDALNYHVGRYQIEYKSLNDAGARGWTPAAVVRNAREVALDPQSVAYIGDLDSRATEYSLPILNQAGILQITPGSGYPGLTDRVPGITAADEPTEFYPNRSTRTLLRLIPSDLVEAAAALEQLQSEHCVHVGAAVFGGGSEATALQATVAQTARLYGMVYVPPEKANQPGSDPQQYPAYVSYMRSHAVGCFVLIGEVSRQAVALTQAIHAQLPAGYIVGTSGFCSRSWLGSGTSAVPAAAEGYLLCTSPTLPLTRYPGIRTFMGLYRQLPGKHPKNPSPYAIYGYQAAEMVLNVVDGFSNATDNRKQTLMRTVGMSPFPLYSAVLGIKYSFDKSGDTTSHAYGIYGFRDGRLVYETTLSPKLVIGPNAG